MEYHHKQLLTLFREWSGGESQSFERLPHSGSSREYYRIKDSRNSAIGVYNADEKENHAFISFCKHFKRHQLNVPAIYGEDLKNKIYLLEDLGDTTLLSYIEKNREGDLLSEPIKKTYKTIVEILPDFQINAGSDVDYTVCYPRPAFDKQSILWDLHYFKNYFLKFLKIPFYEQELEDDFNSFADYLVSAGCEHFMYRDFQSRNIMLVNHVPYFIDFQGGRKGALQYDIASLLFEAKTKLPEDFRNEILEYYLSALSKHLRFNKSEFMSFYYPFALVRTMQACGAYGFRGLYEKKPLFIQSIPHAVKNIEYLLKHTHPLKNFPELYKALSKIPGNSELKSIISTFATLTVDIYSFSYHKAIPYDQSGHGGGFVFDCRCLPNPGKNSTLKQFTGNDDKIQTFFENEAAPEINRFMRPVVMLVENSINKYLTENYTHLMVCFGCTGGRHRSVYCANQLAQKLRERKDIEVRLTHNEI